MPFCSMNCSLSSTSWASLTLSISGSACAITSSKAFFISFFASAWSSKSSHLGRAEAFSFTAPSASFPVSPSFSAASRNMFFAICSIRRSGIFFIVFAFMWVLSITIPESLFIIPFSSICRTISVMISSMVFSSRRIFLNLHKVEASGSSCIGDIWQKYS